MNKGMLLAILSILTLASCSVNVPSTIEVQSPSQAGETITNAERSDRQASIDATSVVSDTETLESNQPVTTTTSEPSQSTRANAPRSPTTDRETPVVEQVAWVTVTSGNVVLGSTADQVASAQSACAPAGRDCDATRFERETPQDLVFVDEFEITKFEITNEQYQPCVLGGVCQPPRTNLDESPIPYRVEFSEPDRPVVGVSAIEASIFCGEWLGGRLPHRAEWERAARGNDARIYPWGDIFDPTKANLIGSAASPGDSHPAGSSPFGVFHMTGNVWEWTDQDVRMAGNMPPTLVVRGGSWNSLPFEGRIAYLGESLHPSLARYDVGIRCVRERKGHLIVQQLEPIEIRFELEGNTLHWLVDNAASANITCYPVLGRTISGHWAVEIGAEGSAATPDDSVTCSLVATGYDGSSDSAVLTFGSLSPSCALAPAPVFADIYQQHATDLGCPMEEIVTIPTIAEQAFQGGYMLWRSDTDAVYVVYGPAGEWQSDPGWKWDGSDPDGIGLSPPPGYLEPKRGFGWLWRTHLGAENGALGWATELEKGYQNTGQAQLFEGGSLVKGSGPKVFVLLYKSQR